ncbi:MAG: hypothetical protein R3B06_12490 [Kofleriaceae bacterium]
MTTAELRSVANGFWACAAHARLVDTNAGRAYPAGKLLGWRALHEARTRAEMDGQRPSVRWVESLEVRASPAPAGRAPIFEAGARVNLAKVTLLIGDNSDGKTALCEWLASVGDEAHLWGWSRSTLAFTIRIHDPDDHTFDVDLSEGTLTMRFDGKAVPFCPLPVSVRPVLEPPTRAAGMSDADWMSLWLGIPTAVIARLLTDAPRRFPRLVGSVRAGDDGEIVTVRDGFPASLRAIGTSGQWLIAIALAALHADQRAAFVPTILLIDGIWSLDSNNKAAVLRDLETIQCQSIATLVAPARDLARGRWAITRIQHGPQGATFADE